MANATTAGPYNEEKKTVPSGGYASGLILAAPSGRYGVVQGVQNLVEGQMCTICTTGRHDVTSASGTTFTAGDDVDWDDTGKLAVAAGDGDFHIGVASAAKASGTTTVEVILSTENRIDSPTQVIADPGASGAIPVTRSGQCAVTTAGAESRTVAIPTFVGQTLSISLDVDGGDLTVTFASAINQAGNTIATIADAGDHLKVEGVQVAGAPVWRVIANDGATLS